MVEAHTWGFTDKTVDPGEVLLRLVTQSSMRVARYADELEQLVTSDGFQEAMAGDVMIPTKYGQYKAGEYPRVLARWEAEERDRCANFAAKAIAAGLNERMVRVAEQQGQQMMAMVQAALGRVSMTPEQVAAFRKELAIEVRSLDDSTKK